MEEEAFICKAYKKGFELMFYGDDSRGYFVKHNGRIWWCGAEYDRGRILYSGILQQELNK